MTVLVLWKSEVTELNLKQRYFKPTQSCKVMKKNDLFLKSRVGRAPRRGSQPGLRDVFRLSTDFSTEIHRCERGSLPAGFRDPVENCFRYVPNHS